MVLCRQFWSSGSRRRLHHLACLIAGVKRPGLDVHDMSLARGRVDVLGYDLSPASACCSGTLPSELCEFARTVSVRRCISGRAMELISGHESFFGAQPSRSALNPSCQFQVRTFVLLGVRTSVVDCTHGTGSILYLLRSDWSLRWFDVCICTDASEKCFSFAVRVGCRELASEVGRASERTKFMRSSRSVCAGSRALRSIAPDVDLD